MSSDGPHLHWSAWVWWAREELNLRPLPCQQNPGNRCATCRFPRSPPTVDLQGKRSLSALRRCRCDTRVARANLQFLEHIGVSAPHACLLCSLADDTRIALDRPRSSSELLPPLPGASERRAHWPSIRSMTPQVRLVGTGCWWMPGGLRGSGGRGPEDAPHKRLHRPVVRSRIQVPGVQVVGV